MGSSSTARTEASRCEYTDKLHWLFDLGDNGIDGPAIGHLRGRNSTVRNLTFKHFLESLQIIGPDNVVERNVFLGHTCSDDAVSTTTVQSMNATIRNNRFQDYRDKAYQMSLGSGTIEGNTFVEYRAADPRSVRQLARRGLRDSVERLHDDRQSRSVHRRDD